MIDGKRYSRYAKTITECRNKIGKLRFFGTEKKAEDYTVEEWINKWLEEEVKPQRREKTYMDYKSIAKNHLIPAFSNIFLSDLSRKDIQSFVDRQKRRGLNPSTIKIHFNVLSASIKLAEKDQLITLNPCRFVALPKEDKPTRAWLSTEQLKIFLNAKSSNETIDNALKTSALTGMRRGEILSLHWSDIDFDNKTIKISRSLTNTQKGFVVSKTKTKDSARSIPINNDVAEILMRQQRVTGEYSLVFSHKGKIIHHALLRYHLKKMTRENNLPDIRIHDLRHSFASILHGANVDHKTIQSLLGHSNIQTTLNIYVHPDEENKKKAAQTMSDLLK